MDMSEAQLNDFSQALAEGIAQADRLRQESEKARDRENEAKGAISLAGKAYGGQALKALDECGAWPKAPDFDKLENYLLACNDTERVLEGIERELAWCEKTLAGEHVELTGLEVEAAEVADEYRKKMLGFARGLVADGEALDVACVPSFEGGFEAWSQVKTGRISELLAEVKVAYEKYRKVVDDNGPFSLHPTVGIGDEEKLADCLDELKEANAKPYMGVLDDDFMDHVDAFWLGFDKLARLCSSRATANPAPLLSYFERVSRGLGEALEGKQLADFDYLTLLSELRKSCDIDSNEFEDGPTNEDDEGF